MDKYDKVIQEITSFDIPSGISKWVLQDTERTARQNKDFLCALFGLTAENEYRRYIEVERSIDEIIADNIVEVYDLIQAIIDLAGTSDTTFSYAEKKVYLDGGKTQVRLGKYLRKNIKKALRAGRHSILYRLLKLSDSRCLVSEQFRFLENITPEYSDEDAAELFNKKVLPQLLSLSPRDVTTKTRILLSANWEDFVLCSATGHFRSCLAPNGEYFATAWLYARAPEVLVAFYLNDDQRIGRFFLFFDVPRFIQGPTYGNFPPTQAKHLRLWIEKRMVEAGYVKEDKWKVRQLEDYMVDFDARYEDSDGPYYVDLVHKTNDCKIIFPKEIGDKWDDRFEDPFGNEESRCLWCGEWSRDGSTTCTNIQCIECDVMICENNAVRSGGFWYCASCASKFIRCDRCGELTSDGTLLVETKDCTEEWCEACAYSYATRCDCCGDLAADSIIVDSCDGVPLCISCAKECQECGNVYAWSDIDNNGLCNDCAMQVEEGVA